MTNQGALAIRSQYDVIIVGSGFSGSLLAWILCRSELAVLLIDRTAHPRFAIGESSTPIADFLLWHIAKRWNLEPLKPLAKWGTWKSTYPQVGCGKKRGFSYYRHLANQPYTDDLRHSYSYLVAASSDDGSSDTHWLRSDVDHFLFRQALNDGVEAAVPAQMSSALWDSQSRCWSVRIENRAESYGIRSRWLIDASGNGRAMQTWTGTTDVSHRMKTRTGAIYAHFRGVSSFSCNTPDGLEDQRLYFDGDDAAQHHLMDDGWLWVLRFDHGVASVGMVLPEASFLSIETQAEAEKLWLGRLRKYPSIGQLLTRAQMVAPAGGLQWAPRLSRRLNLAAGPGWASLPNAFGFIDPLHSTGIAHALSGVVRLAIALSQRDPQAHLDRYAVELEKEIEWIDEIVSGCYSALPCFDRFIGMSAFYFLSTIGTERHLKLGQLEWPSGFFHCNDSELREVLRNAKKKIEDRHSSDSPDVFNDWIRESIAPWNDVGLLDPNRRNRMAHTATKS